MRSPVEPTLFRPGDIFARSGGQAFQQPLFDDGRRCRRAGAKNVTAGAQTAPAAVTTTQAGYPD